MPRAFFSDSFNDIHEIKCGQAEEKLEAGGDEKLIFNFIWPYYMHMCFNNYCDVWVDVSLVFVFYYYHALLFS